MDRIIFIFVDERIVYFCFSSIIDSGKRVHNFIFFYFVSIFGIFFNDVGNSISKVDKNANDDDFEGMFCKFIIEEIFLVSPIKYIHCSFFKI